ncbi:MAG: hypothetical protein PHF00_08655 [Elusimicrobia bacterium]|nr:hypothetical protein [Elusimicrobiota bacterium]
MRRAFFLAVLLAAACGRAPKPDEPVSYRAPDGSFSALLPAGWRVDESPGESRKAAFFGPPQGSRPFSELIGVYFHAATDPASAGRAYLAGPISGPGPFSPRPVRVGAASGLEVTAERPSPNGRSRVAQRVVVVAVPGGFFSLEHAWPADGAASPAFDEFLRSFQVPAGR